MTGLPSGIGQPPALRTLLNRATHVHATARAPYAPSDRDDTSSKVFNWGNRIGLAGIAFDYVRMTAAIPDARRNKRLGKLLFAMLPIVGPGPTTNVVPYQTGKWKAAYRAANVFGTMMLPLNVAIAAPSLVAGWSQGGGPQGLLDTKAGRTGLLSSVGPGMALGAMAFGIMSAHGHGERGWKMLRGAIDTPMRGNFSIGVTNVVMGQLALANEAGVFDFANHGSDVGFSTSVVAGVKNLPHTAGHIYLGM